MGNVPRKKTHANGDLAQMDDEEETPHQDGRRDGSMNGVSILRGGSVGLTRGKSASTHTSHSRVRVASHATTPSNTTSDTPLYSGVFYEGVAHGLQKQALYILLLATMVCIFVYRTWATRRGVARGANVHFRSVRTNIGGRLGN